MYNTKTTLGLDIGGAHLKAVLLKKDKETILSNATILRTPLWQGLKSLEDHLLDIKKKWYINGGTKVVCTMTGEMADFFDNRQEGVNRISQVIFSVFGSKIYFYSTSGLTRSLHSSLRKKIIASANWHATASIISKLIPSCLIIDVGSTTTDIIPIRDHRVLTPEKSSDHQRLQTGELVYVGINRTPICSIANTLIFRASTVNVTREFFASTSDIFRLTGDLKEKFDFYPACDGKIKSKTGSQKRLARMIGLDLSDAREKEWIGLARNLKGIILEELIINLKKVLNHYRISNNCLLILSGSGIFLGSELAKKLQCPSQNISETFNHVLSIKPELKEFSEICAPSVSIALLSIL